MDNDKLTKMLARAHLLKFDDGEVKLLECLFSIRGSF